MRCKFLDKFKFVELIIPLRRHRVNVCRVFGGSRHPAVHRIQATGQLRPPEKQENWQIRAICQLLYKITPPGTSQIEQQAFSYPFASVDSVGVVVSVGSVGLGSTRAMILSRDL